MAPKKAKDDAKVPQLKGTEAEQALLAYLKSVNRPYNATDISLNIKTVGKTVTQKALVALSESNCITSKTYGKQIVYWARQEGLTDESEDTEILEKLQEETKVANEDIKGLREANKKLSSSKDQMNAQPKTQDIAQLISSLSEQNRKLSAHLDELKGNPESGQTISKLQVEYQLKVFKQAWSLWQARRKKFREILDMLLPDGGKEERTNFVEDLLGESDESAQVKEIEKEEQAKLSRPLKRRKP